MIKQAIAKIVQNRDLTEREMEQVMKRITAGRVSGPEIASFVTALRIKGETPEEITAAARIIRGRLSVIHGGDDVVSLDREEITVERETILSTAKGLTRGTTIFNISTATVLVAAGAGLRIAKHGRRADTALCGSADVIAALGVNLEMTSTQLERCIQELGICFFYEPLLQKGMEHIVTIRRQIGIRTIFNCLDPLINPAGARIQVLGVYEPGLTETMATVLRNLGIESALVVHGDDTLDEISITGKTKVTELREGTTTTYSIQPEDFGLKRRKLAEICGGTQQENAQIILKILQGARGARRDIVLLNTSAALVIAGRARDFREGIELATESIDSGEALKKLNKVVDFTRAESPYLRRDYEVDGERSLRT